LAAEFEQAALDDQRLVGRAALQHDGLVVAHCAAPVAFLVRGERRQQIEVPLGREVEVAHLEVAQHRVDLVPALLGGQRTGLLEVLDGQRDLLVGARRERRGEERQEQESAHQRWVAGASSSARQARSGRSRW
jgi:hypothetical protein